MLRAGPQIIQICFFASEHLNFRSFCDMLCVFYRVMHTFGAQFNERGYYSDEVEVWGPVGYYVTNAYNFFHTFIQWGRFLMVPRILPFA